MPNAPAIRSQVQRAPNADRGQMTLTTVENTLRANNASEVKAIRAMLGGDKVLMDRFVAVAVKALAKETDLLRKATPLSILDSIMTAASMGLEPMTDDGAIVVYGDKASFQPMYRGYLKRIRNSGTVDEIDTQIVYEEDEFEMGFGTDPFIRHVPARILKDDSGVPVQDRGGYRGAYAWARLKGSPRPIIEWMEEVEINYVRDTFSQAARSDSPWRKSWGEMARKTALRRLAKRLPASAVDVLLAADLAADREARAMSPELAPDDPRRLAMQAAVALMPGTVAPQTEAPAAETAAPEPKPDAAPQEAPPVAVGSLFDE